MKMIGLYITTWTLLLLVMPVVGDDKSPVGVYSNNSQGFKAVTVVIGRNGTGFLSSSAGVSIPLRKWSYDVATQEVVIEGPLGKESKSKTLEFRYDSKSKTLVSIGEWELGTLRKGDADKVEKYLRLWDRIPNKEALKIAEAVSSSDLLKAGDVSITTMNIDEPEIQKHLKELGFSLEDNDEVFSIISNQSGLQITVQVRKVAENWESVKKCSTRIR